MSFTQTRRVKDGFVVSVAPIQTKHKLSTVSKEAMRKIEHVRRVRGDTWNEAQHTLFPSVK